MSTFPAGNGVAQGPVSGMSTQANPVNLGSTAVVTRPQPADPGGTNDAGWMKTSDYPSGGEYDGDSGPWRQT